MVSFRIVSSLLFEMSQFESAQKCYGEVTTRGRDPSAAPSVNQPAEGPYTPKRLPVIGARVGFAARKAGQLYGMDNRK
jgi:hypothetical protein